MNINLQYRDNIIIQPNNVNNYNNSPPQNHYSATRRLSPFEPLTKDRQYNNWPGQCGGKISPLPIDEYEIWQKRREENQQLHQEENKKRLQQKQRKLPSTALDMNMGRRGEIMEKVIVSYPLQRPIPVSPAESANGQHDVKTMKIDARHDKVVNAQVQEEATVDDDDENENELNNHHCSQEDEQEHGRDAGFLLSSRDDLLHENQLLKRRILQLEQRLKRTEEDCCWSRATTTSANASASGFCNDDSDDSDDKSAEDMMTKVAKSSMPSSVPCDSHDESGQTYFHSLEQQQYGSDDGGTDGTSMVATTRRNIHVNHPMDVKENEKEKDKDNHGVRNGYHRGRDWIQPREKSVNCEANGERQEMRMKTKKTAPIQSQTGTCDDAREMRDEGGSKETSLKSPLSIDDSHITMNGINEFKPGTLNHEGHTRMIGRKRQRKDF